MRLLCFVHTWRQRYHQCFILNKYLCKRKHIEWIWTLSLHQCLHCYWHKVKLWWWCKGRSQVWKDLCSPWLVFCPSVPPVMAFRWVTYQCCRCRVCLLAASSGSAPWPAAAWCCSDSLWTISQGTCRQEEKLLSQHVNLWTVYLQTGGNCWVSIWVRLSGQGIRNREKGSTVEREVLVEDGSKWRV